MRQGLRFFYVLRAYVLARLRAPDSASLFAYIHRIDQLLPCHARLSVLELQTYGRFARMFLHQVSQLLRVGYHPELGIFGGLRHLLRQWLEQIRMQAGFRLVERQQRRRMWAEKRGQQAQVAQCPVGKLAGARRICRA